MNWAQRMGIECRRERQIPLGVQLDWGLRSAIARGELAAGERLPTLRQLAEEVGANLNTVRAVYVQLERDRLIDTHQGKGSYVLGQPPGSALGLSNALAQALRAAREAGLTAGELAAALYVTPDSESRPDPEVVARRRIRAEIAVLEGALSALYAQHPGLPIEPGSELEPDGPRILGADELRRQRDAVLDRLLSARAALNEWAASETEAAAEDRSELVRPRPATPRGPAGPRIAPA